MRRRACVYQKITPVMKNFHNSGQSHTDFKMSLQYSSMFHISYFKENSSFKSKESLGCSNWFRNDRRGRGFTGMARKIFDRSKLVPCKNSRRESVKIVEIVQNRIGTINFYRTRIREPVIITRIKSSRNLLIFLVCFLAFFSVDFTHLVLSLLAGRTCNV